MKDTGLDQDIQQQQINMVEDVSWMDRGGSWWIVYRSWMDRGWIVDESWMDRGWSVDGSWMEGGWIMDGLWWIVVEQLMRKEKTLAERSCLEDLRNNSTSIEQGLEGDFLDGGR